MTYEDNIFPRSQDYTQYLTGYLRTIYFQAVTKFDDGSNSYDPNVPATNAIIYIFEGYFKEGFLVDVPTFGRWFKRDLKCYVGFFAVEGNLSNLFLFKGKGMVFDGFKELEVNG